MNVTQQIPVYVISLLRHQARRDAIAAHLRKLNVSFEFIDAVDGRTIPASHLRDLQEPGLEMPVGHVGCYLSHISVFRRIVEQNQSFALILEDDARISDRLASHIRRGLARPDFDYCFLDSENFNNKGPVFYDANSGFEIAEGLEAYELSHGPQTTHAYLVGLRAASLRVAHALPIRCPIDIYDHLPYKISFTAVVKPKLAWLSEFSTESSTFDQKTRASISFKALKRSFLYYKLRDLLLLKTLQWRREVREAIASGRIPPGKAWKRLPSGKEIVVD